jgi:RNA-dependent RNA polymerase
MEKRHKPKDAQYHSGKILGLLYDKVETVNFMPQYEEPFDKRILRAYHPLDDTLLKTVRQIKTKYDTAMRRLLAQQEVKTEFEIWSTFVLSKPRVGSDYKLQEEIARISDALKDQFRSVCIEKAGSKDFSVLGPFVAAMYKVTKEELDIALAECRSTKIVGGREVPRRKMEPKNMPLITFPWLFEKELGRIATGVDASDELEELGLATLTLGESGQSRKRQGGGRVDLDDYIQQEDGIIVHRGEELDLFRLDVDSEGLSDDVDFDVRETHDFRKGDSGELVHAAEFQILDSPIPEYLLSGTGVEDVVPRTIMDGFDDPREMPAHESTGFGPTYFNNNSWRPGPSSNTSNLVAQYSVLNTKDGANPPTTPDYSPNATPSSPIAALGLGTAALELPEQVEEEIVELDIKESSLEKLAKLVGEPNGSGTTGPEENTIEEEVIDVEIRESSLEKLAKLVGEPDS